MGKAHSKGVLRDLRQRISRLEGMPSSTGLLTLPFGLEALDRHLPNGGLALGTLHEIAGAANDSDEAAATMFVAGILARTTGTLLWCVKSFDLFIHGLANAGLTDDRIIFVEAHDEKTVLLAMEEGLRHGDLAGVVGEITSLSPNAGRRLHLASRASGVTGFLLHRLSRYQKIPLEENSSASTRWRITSLPSSPLPVAGIGRSQWKIELTRCRDGAAAEWIMEACDASGYLAIPSNLSNRSSATPEAWRLSA